MSIKKQEKKQAKTRRINDGWDRAIAEAKTRIQQLNFSIAIFKKHKRAGEPWLGDRATQN
jgi:hypothetical protein